MNDERTTTLRKDPLRFYTSDPHYFHDNIIKLCGRPFRSAHHMNEVLVRNHNSVVRPGDIVYVLGDVVMGRGFEENLRILDRLNGFLVLLPGNHDRVSDPWTKGNEQKRERWYKEYRRHFDVVLNDRVRTDQRLADGTLVQLSHYPYAGDSQDLDRHSRMRPVDDGGLLVHGHVHEKWRTRGRMFNVGVDVNNFTPVSEETIIEWAKGAA